MFYGVVEPLVRATTDGPALTNSAAATSILPPNARKYIPAGFLNDVGAQINIRAHGRISTVVTTPGTLTYDVRVGGIIVSGLGAISLNTVAKTNVGWMLELLGTVRSVGPGTAATMLWQGRWQSEAVIGSPLPTAGGNGDVNLPASAPAVGNGFDSTAASILDLFATWSVANASNSLTLHQYTAWLI